MRAQHGISTIIIALFTGFFVACEDAPDREPPASVVAPAEGEPIPPEIIAALPEGTDPALVREGQRQYLVCSVCHGLDGRGTPLGPSLRSGEWIHIEGNMEEIEAIVRSGVDSPEEYPIPMPVMGGGAFTAEELRAVTTYVFALSRSGS